MSVLSPTIALARFANALRLAAPREWEAFVEYFDAYANEVTVAVTVADQNSILNAQGRAQAFRHLAQTFRDCHVTPKTEPPSA